MQTSAQFVTIPVVSLFIARCWSWCWAAFPSALAFLVSVCPHLLFLGLRAVAVKGVSQAYCPRVTLNYRVHLHVLRHPDSRASLRTWMLRSRLAASLIFSLVSFLLPRLLLGLRVVTWGHKSIVHAVSGWASLIKR